MLAPGMSVAAARDAIVAELHKAGVADAALAARVFVEDATGFGRGGAGRRSAAPIGPEAAATLKAWVARRLAGEPVFRIVGEREFWGLPFAVTPDVLDPRPDTETIVEAALAALGDRRAGSLRICDLGIGSGALLAALLSACPAAVGWGVDRSLAASRVAQHNLRSLGLGARALLLQGSWAEALPAGGFDLVVSNPPYVVTAEISTLEREVRDHDPHLALDGGPDGLACYRDIARDLPRLLVPGGLAVFELGAGQADAVRTLCEAAGLLHDATKTDLGGHERALVVRRPAWPHRPGNSFARPSGMG